MVNWIYSIRAAATAAATADPPKRAVFDTAPLPPGGGAFSTAGTGAVGAALVDLGGAGGDGVGAEGGGGVVVDGAGEEAWGGGEAVGEGAEAGGVATGARLGGVEGGELVGAAFGDAVGAAPGDWARAEPAIKAKSASKRNVERAAINESRTNQNFLELMTAGGEREGRASKRQN